MVRLVPVERRFVPQLGSNPMTMGVAMPVAIGMGMVVSIGVVPPRLRMNAPVTLMALIVTGTVAMAMSMAAVEPRRHRINGFVMRMLVGQQRAREQAGCGPDDRVGAVVGTGRGRCRRQHSDEKRNKEELGHPGFPTMSSPGNMPRSKTVFQPPRNAPEHLSLRWTHDGADILGGASCRSGALEDLLTAGRRSPRRLPPRRFGRRRQ